MYRKNSSDTPAASRKFHSSAHHLATSYLLLQMLARASSHALVSLPESAFVEPEPVCHKTLVTHIEHLSHCDTLGSTLVGLGVKMCMESVLLSNERSLLRTHICILRQFAAQSVNLHGDGVSAAYRRSESNQFLYLVTPSRVHFTDPTPHPANPALGLYSPGPMTHPRVMPPSTSRLTPVMKEAALEARSTMGAATSSGSDTRPRGWVVASPASRSALGTPFASAMPSYSSVLITPAFSSSLTPCAKGATDEHNRHDFGC